MSAAFFGGLFLIIGSFFVAKGMIFHSVFVYFLADICWIIISISAGDIFGAGTVIIGTIFGLIAFYKMNKGKMRKDLHW